MDDWVFVGIHQATLGESYPLCKLAQIWAIVYGHIWHLWEAVWEMASPSGDRHAGGLATSQPFLKKLLENFKSIPHIAIWNIKRSLQPIRRRRSSDRQKCPASAKTPFFREAGHFLRWLKPAFYRPNFRGWNPHSLVAKRTGILPKIWVLDRYIYPSKTTPFQIDSRRGCKVSVMSRWTERG